MRCSSRILWLWVAIAACGSDPSETAPSETGNDPSGPTGDTGPTGAACDALAAAWCPLGPGAPCTLDAVETLTADCVVDLAGVDLTLAPTAALSAGAFALTLELGSLVAEPGSTLAAEPGGALAIDATGDVALGGAVTGGYAALTVAAGGSVTVGGSIGPTTSALGGAVVGITAGGDVAVDGTLDLRALSFGTGYPPPATLTIDAGGDVLVAATGTVDGTGGYYDGGATIHVTSASGAVELAGTVEAGGWSTGGDVAFDGCAVDVPGTLQAINAYVTLTSRASTTIAGTVTAGLYGGSVALEYRDAAPVITGEVVPEPISVHRPDLAPCP